MKITQIQNRSYPYLVDWDHQFVSLADWKQMRDWCMLTWGVGEIHNIYNGQIAFHKLADAEWFLLRWS